MQHTNAASSYYDEPDEDVTLTDIILQDETDRPFGPAEDEEDGFKLPVDHPALDSNIDQQELYDEGLAGAAELPALATSSEEEEDDVSYY